MWPYLKPAYSQATRMVAPVTVRASQLRGGYLPTGVVATLEDAAATTGGTCTTVRPPETLVRQMPKGMPHRDADYAPWLSEHVDRLAVAELPGGRVLSPHSAVITGNDDLLVEVSLYFGTTRAREHPIFLHPFPGMPQEVGGRLGLLAHRGDANYYHFLIDVLPRIGVLEESGVAAPELWYVPMEMSFQRELLELMGIDASRCIDSTKTRHVVAETLIVPSPPAMTLVNPPWVVEFLRRRLLPPGVERVPGRGIYIRRGGGPNNRRVENEAELEAYLSDRGFTVLQMEGLPVTEQIRQFAEASLIVAAHGAALMNLAFASPGSAVVEIFPAGSTNQCYWKLAEGVPGLEYRYVLGRGAESSRSLSEMLVADIDVDLQTVGQTLDELGWS
jgi:capsular polysaccharide biosynthesis protein